MSTQMECSTESMVSDGVVPGVDMTPGLAPSPFCSCAAPLGVEIGGRCATCRAKAEALSVTLVGRRYRPAWQTSSEFVCSLSAVLRHGLDKEIESSLQQV